jgi:hypothetical protein
MNVRADKEQNGESAPTLNSRPLAGDYYLSLVQNGLVKFFLQQRWLLISLHYSYAMVAVYSETRAISVLVEMEMELLDQEPVLAGKAPLRE